MYNDFTNHKALKEDTKVTKIFMNLEKKDENLGVLCDYFVSFVVITIQPIRIIKV